MKLLILVFNLKDELREHRQKEKYRLQVRQLKRQALQKALAETGFVGCLLAELERRRAPKPPPGQTR